MAVSFIGGGNRSTQRSIVSHGQTLSHNVVSSTPRHERGSNSQHIVVIGTDYLLIVLNADNFGRSPDFVTCMFVSRTY